MFVVADDVNSLWTGGRLAAPTTARKSGVNIILYSQTRKGISPNPVIRFVTHDTFSETTRGSGRRSFTDVFHPVFALKHLKVGSSGAADRGFVPSSMLLQEGGGKKTLISILSDSRRPVPDVLTEMELHKV